MRHRARYTARFLALRSRWPRTSTDRPQSYSMGSGHDDLAPIWRCSVFIDQHDHYWLCHRLSCRRGLHNDFRCACSKLHPSRIICSPPGGRLERRRHGRIRRRFDFRRRHQAGSWRAGNCMPAIRTRIFAGRCEHDVDSPFELRGTLDQRDRRGGRRRLPLTDVQQRFAVAGRVGSAAHHARIAIDFHRETQAPQHPRQRGVPWKQREQQRRGGQDLRIARVEVLTLVEQRHLLRIGRRGRAASAGKPRAAAASRRRPVLRPARPSPNAVPNRCVGQRRAWRASRHREAP